MTKNPNKQQNALKSNNIGVEYAAVMREFSRIISSSLDRQEVLRQSLQQLSRVLVFDSASIYLLPRNGQNEFVAGIGFEDEDITSRAAESLLQESGIVQKIVQKQEPIICPDVRNLSEWVWVPGAEHVRSFVGIPLIVHGYSIGTLMLDSQEENHFQAADLEIVQSLAQQIAISIENAWLYEDVQRQLRLSQTLQKVGALLTTRLRLQEVYERIFDLLAQVVDYDSVSLQLLKPDGKTLEMAAGRGFDDLEAAENFVAGISKHSLNKFSNKQKWQVISNTSTNPLWQPLPASLRPIRSWIGAVLMIQNRLIGILNVDSHTPDAYREEMGETVLAFANQAAVAIENARLYEETRQRADEMAVLHHVAVQTAVIMDVDELLQRTTEMIAASLYPDMFGFVLFDEEKQVLIPHASYHGLTPEQRKTPVSLHESIVSYVVRSGQMWNAADVSHDPFYRNLVPKTRSQIAVPLMVKGRIFGVINAESPRLSAFSESDARFLTTLAGQVAVAIEQARLYEALQRHANELSEEVTQSTAQLQAERDRNLAILEGAGEGIFLTDREGTILYVNPAMERQSGYSREEMIDQNPRIFQSGQTSPTVFRDMWATVTDGQRWSGEIINRRKDGTLYDVALTIMPVVDDDGQVVNFISVQSDISRLKEVERLKTQFVSNVSHELRTPLTNITTYLTLLERGPEERKGRYLQVLNNETQRLTRLIQDLLDLSRLETGPIPEAIVPSDLSASLKANYDAFLAQADAKQIQFEIDVAPNLPFIGVEKNHLTQLLTNLLGNAIAYTPNGGRVTIQAGVANDMACVNVADTGVGIPKEEIPRLFDRFFRGAAAQDGATPGTGLGLAICKEILDRYGGRIEVESEVGVGSIFTVWLPLARS